MGIRESIRDLWRRNQKVAAAEQIFQVLRRNPDRGMELPEDDPLLMEVVQILVRQYPQTEIIRPGSGKLTVIFKDKLQASKETKEFIRGSGMLQDRDTFKIE